MQSQLWLLITLISFLSCNQPQEFKSQSVEGIEKQDTIGQLVIFFQRPPKNNSYQSSKGIAKVGIYEISYVDDELMTRLLPFTYAPGSDTLVITTKRKVIEITHAYRGLDKLSYLFQRGDSVLFTYSGQKPFAKVLNRQSLPLEINYDIMQRERICKDDFPASIKGQDLNTLFSLYDFNKANNLGAEYRKWHKIASKEAQNEYEKETRLLDSLTQRGQLSQTSSQFYKLKSSYSLQSLQACQPNLFLIRETLDQAFVSTITQTIKEKQQDSLLYFGFYRDMLKVVLNIENRKVKRQIGQSSNQPDYRAVYDSIQTNPWLSEKSKAVLLLDNMDKLMHQCSAEERQMYLKRFEANVKDKALVKLVTSKYKLEPKVSHELSLQTLTRKKLTFQQVLSQSKGKVVYVDFWASWCAPCIGVIPASKELQRVYRNKQVVFVYVSKDENFDHWQKAVHKYGLADQLNNYIIDNLYTTQLLEELEINLIPRYLIYDKQGKLVHTQAPGPKGEEIKGLFEKYLAE